METKEVQKYMEHMVQLLRQQFGEQLLYVGLQGSCRRGETTENSDIDAVVVLEELSIPHLQQYKMCIRDSPAAERALFFL